MTLTEWPYWWLWQDGLTDEFDRMALLISFPALSLFSLLSLGCLYRYMMALPTPLAFKPSLLIAGNCNTGSQEAGTYTLYENSLWLLHVVRIFFGIHYEPKGSNQEPLNSHMDCTSCRIRKNCSRICRCGRLLSGRGANHSCHGTKV
jgi:hypothetical protein